MAFETPMKRQRISETEEEEATVVCHKGKQLAPGFSVSFQPATFNGMPLHELLGDLGNRIMEFEVFKADFEKYRQTSEERVAHAEDRINNLEAELQHKAQKDYVDNKLAEKAHRDHLHPELASKVYVDDALLKKADQDSIQAELRRVVDVKADKAVVGPLLVDYAQEVSKVREEMTVEFVKKADKLFVSTELQRLDNGKADKAHLIAEIEKQNAAAAARAAVANTELEKRTVELKREQAAAADHAAAELAKRDAEREKQQAVAAAELAKRDAEREKQQAATAVELAKRDAELEKQRAAVAARTAFVDAELAKKSGKEFLAAQVANLSEGARKAHKEIETAIKEEIDFTPSSSELTSSGKKIIRRLAEVLKKHSNMKIRVEGHTGCRCIAGGGQPKRGDGCKAVALSQSRAESVVDALKSLGCTNQLQSTGHGCIFRVGMAVKVFPASGQ